MNTYANVDEYIQKADKEKQQILLEMREIIISTIPSVEEKIAYSMPAYLYKGKPLLYFAAMKGHLGIYPTPGPIATLQTELQGFSTSKGCVRIPYGKRLPKKLVVQLLKERIREIKSEK
ncbi:MAG: hypothetical protein RI996_26 [Candidatus Parcubacteria bacterium]|jgi:uncharacterized protein YdhG (YjbR/CyaY superfamily)